MLEYQKTKARKKLAFIVGLILLSPLFIEFHPEKMTLEMWFCLFVLLIEITQSIIKTIKEAI